MEQERMLRMLEKLRERLLGLQAGDSFAERSCWIGLTPLPTKKSVTTSTPRPLSHRCCFPSVASCFLSAGAKVKQPSRQLCQ